MGRPKTSGGSRPTVSGGRVTGSAVTMWSGTSAQRKFLKAVLKAAIMFRLNRGRTRLESLKADQLEKVPGSGGIVTAIDAAGPAGNFLVAAKEALKKARSKAQSVKDATSNPPKPRVDSQDEDILNTVDVKITGYRSVEQEEKLWKGYFPGYYNRTSKDRSSFKDPHGKEAVKFMVRFISGKKAPPGFSMHTLGVSIDFYQKRKIDGRETWVRNSTVKGTKPGQLRWWYGTWFYSWLHDNAGTFGFKELATEAWHYDYVGI